MSEKLKWAGGVAGAGGVVALLTAFSQFDNFICLQSEIDALQKQIAIEHAASDSRIDSLEKRIDERRNSDIKQWQLLREHEHGQNDQ